MQDILQIIHLSDQHINLQPVPLGMLHLLRGAAYLGDDAYSFTARGVWPFDPAASRRLKRRLQAIASEWASTTWLFGTGDHTTYGDSTSYNRAEEIFTSHAEASEADHHHWIHGNHDAWPDDHPFAATDSKLKNRKLDLKRRGCVVETAVLLCEEVSKNFAVQAYALDTVRYERTPNSFAFGWPAGGSVEKLAELSTKHIRSVPTIRLLLMHHPLVGNGGRAWDTQLWGQSTAVWLVPPRAHPFHLLISGHTHKPSPTTLGAPHRNLPPYMRQVVAGAALEAAPADTTRLNQHFQVLRLRANAENTVQVERQQFSRTAPGGEFDLTRRDDWTFTLT